MEAALLFGSRSLAPSVALKALVVEKKHCVIFMGSTDRKISTWTLRIPELGQSIYSRELYVIQKKVPGTSLDPGKD